MIYLRVRLKLHHVWTLTSGGQIFSHGEGDMADFLTCII